MSIKYTFSQKLFLQRLSSYNDKKSIQQENIAILNYIETSSHIPEIYTNCQLYLSENGEYLDE